MKNLFVPFELAKQLKEKGFDEPCLAKWMLDVKGDTIPHFRYNYSSEGLWFKHNSKDVSDTNGYKNEIDFLWSAPMYQQVVDWFREKHKIHITVNEDFDNGKFLGYCGLISDNDGFTETKTKHNYYEAFNDAIEHALKIKLFKTK